MSDTIDLTFLKKRAEFLNGIEDSFNDEKVQAALAKVSVPKITFDSDPIGAGIFECLVPNKAIRFWIDMIPDKDRSYVKFIYTDGDDQNIEKYIKFAMTAPAFKNFQSFVSMDASESDTYLMRYLIWHSIILKKPVGFDFKIFEANMIFNNLPIDISRNKITMNNNMDFAEFYKAIVFAKWGIANAN